MKNKIDFNKLKQLLSYSNRYDISIQFWTEQQAIYIEKHDVPLIDFGGEFNDIIDDAIGYLNRITSSSNKQFPNS
jgi:hypothetical protein